MDMFKIVKYKYTNDPKRNYGLYIKDGDRWGQVIANATKSEILKEISDIWHYFENK